MPRFSFPLPGRRQKTGASAGGSTVSSGRNKKIHHGESHNTKKREAGSTTTSRMSTSGAVLEGRDHFHDGGMRGVGGVGGVSGVYGGTGNSGNGNGNGVMSSLPEGEVVHSTTPRQPHFDEESGVFGYPGTSSDLYAASPFADHRSVDASSSLRHRNSGSTILSYYDKSKVPLVISQQTSNSAMAKGLPPKAHSVLDVDGSLSRKSSTSRRRKPAKLDLSHLIPTRKPSITAASSSSNAHYQHHQHNSSHHHNNNYYNNNNNHQDRNLVLGPDLITRSPSVLSMTNSEQFCSLSRPPSRAHSFRMAFRPSTRGSVRSEHPPDNLSPPPARQHHFQAVEGAYNHPAAMDSLYDHYDKLSVRDWPMEEESLESQESQGSPSEPSTPSWPSPARMMSTPTAAASVNPYARQVAETSLLRKDVSAATGTTATASSLYGGATDQESMYSGMYSSMYSGMASMKSMTSLTPGLTPAVTSPQLGSAGSISSRHRTTTSRASRRSAVQDIDLQQTSMLSLSSDSEDDYVASMQLTSVSEYSSQSSFDVTPSPDQHQHQQHHHRRSSSVQSSKKQEAAGASYSAFPPYPGPPPTYGLPRPGTSRLSNASLATNSTARPLNRRTSKMSKASRGSVVSRASVSSNMTMQTMQTFQRSSVIPPAKNALYSEAPESYATTTPPRSPNSSMVSYGGDETSIRSSQSYASMGSFSTAASSSHSHRGHSRGGSSSNGKARYMAVTRQEEMLLAALRMKKTRMQQPTISESEEEEQEEEQVQEKTLDLLNGVYQPRAPRARKAMTARAEVQTTSSAAMAATTTPPPSSSRHSHSSRPTTRSKTYDSASVMTANSSSKASFSTFAQGHNEVSNSYSMRGVPQTYADVDDDMEDDDLSDFFDFDDIVASQFPTPPSSNAHHLARSHHGNSHHSNSHRSNRNSKQSTSKRHSDQHSKSNNNNNNNKHRKKSRSSNGSMSALMMTTDNGPSYMTMGPHSAGNMVDDQLVDLPRPDSPVEAPLPRKKAVRISAVGLPALRLASGETMMERQ